MSTNFIFRGIVIASTISISFVNQQAAILFLSIPIITYVIGPFILKSRTSSTIEFGSIKEADALLNGIVQAIVKESTITIPIITLVSNLTEIQATVVPFYKRKSYTRSNVAIVITTGLINSFTSAELKATIAHECGHISHKDSTATLFRRLHVVFPLIKIYGAFFTIASIVLRPFFYIINIVDIINDSWKHCF